MATSLRTVFLAGLIVTACWLPIWGTIAFAQISYDNGEDTAFVHSSTSPLWISGQGNSIFQWHPRFPAQYSGPRDKLGVAFVGNGISGNHREYLALGGLGFLLGDGRLTYGPEKIMETYYNFPIPIHRGFFAALDCQYIDDPGYNRARGPVVVLSARLHVEL